MSMNRFLELKRYCLARSQESAEGNNSKENFSTEVLALCLSVSPGLQKAFRDLCGLPEPGLAETWSVETQVQQDGRDNQWDLLLTLGGNNRVRHRAVIEVKVDDSPKAWQLEKYRRQLDGAKGRGEISEWSLFLLCRSWIPRPEVPGCVAISWGQVASEFIKAVVHLGDDTTDRKLAETFKHYLEEENIVVDFDPAKLALINAGRQAEDVLLKVLREIAANVGGQGYGSGTISPKGSFWPRIRWAAKHGKAGQLDVELQFRVAWGNSAGSFVISAGAMDLHQHFPAMSDRAGWEFVRDEGGWKKIEAEDLENARLSFVWALQSVDHGGDWSGDELRCTLVNMLVATFHRFGVLPDKSPVTPAAVQL